MSMEIEALPLLVPFADAPQQLDHDRLNNAFIEAAVCGDLDSLFLLLTDARVRVDAAWTGPRPAPFWTADRPQAALRGACCFGHTDVVDILLQHSNVEATACDNEAIREACANGYAEILLKLLKVPMVRATAYEDVLLSLASIAGHANIVGLLLTQTEVDMSADGFQALIQACGHGHHAIVMMMLAKMQGDETMLRRLPSALPAALKSAAQSGNCALMRMLLSLPDADPAARNNAVLNAALRPNNLAMFRLLLSDGRIDPSANNNNALRYAASQGHKEIVRLLLNSSASVLAAASNLGIMLETLQYGRDKTARELLWRGGWLGPRLAELRAEIGQMRRDVGRRAESTLRTALMRLRREREGICRTVVLLQRLDMPGPILEDIVIFAFGNTLRGTNLREYRQDIASIRARPSPNAIAEVSMR